LRHQRPDLQIIELRGNVETRLRKLDEGQYDAIILATAGLIRLGYGARITARLAASEMLSAVGQGALGIEARLDDQRVNMLLEPLNHWPTRHATEAERAVLRELGGGCAVPIAAFGRVQSRPKGSKLILDALVADVAGRTLLRQRITGSAARGEELGAQLAQSLAAAGARELLPRIGAANTVTAATPPVDEFVVPPADESVSTKAILPEGGTTNLGAELTIQPEVGATNASAVLPLAGRRVIVTRASQQSGELTTALQNLGAEVIACPTIEIREPASWAALDRALIHLSWYDWLAFTSANGVEYFLRRLDELGHGRAELDSHRVCAVGRKTAEKLQSENIAVDLMPARFTAEDLAEEFVNRYGSRQQLRGAQMLLPASHITRDTLRPALAQAGIYVEVVEAYQTVLPATSHEEIAVLLRATQADYIIFTSPSTVSNLATLLETDHLAPHLGTTRIVCIGPITAAAAQSHGLTVHIQPEEHTGEAIVAALVKDCAKHDGTSAANA
jgi:uroporphyrinogen-III synthase